MKIRQFVNDNGKTVKNHFVLTDENGVEYFQSYDSVIVKDDHGEITLGKNWKWSVTTSKYRSMYMHESTADTQKRLDSGKYKYDEKL